MFWAVAEGEGFVVPKQMNFCGDKMQQKLNTKTSRQFNFKFSLTVLCGLLSAMLYTDLILLNE